MYTDVRNLSAECDTDAELQDHRKRIQALSEETAVSLKKNVYKNYMQFIETSKEISCILVIQLSRNSVELYTVPKTAKIVNKINHLSNNLLLNIRADVLFVKIVVALCNFLSFVH